MNKIIGVTELQRKFRSVFDEVVHDHTPYILTRGSRPEAAIIPYDQYVKFIQGRESEVMRRLDETLARMAQVNAHFTDEEVERDVEEASREYRAQRRAREGQAAYEDKPNPARVHKIKK
jgi:prevent-host-death family protein